ncbi:4Fe-4S dicluster domain-containing protein [Planctomycetota bacterium]
MQTVFISKLKVLLDAVAQEMELIVPQKAVEHYIFVKYAPDLMKEIDFNNIRTCMPVKEFLFPALESAVSYPEVSKPQDIKAFAIFGLKECDLRSIEVLDKVFVEDEFVDPFYVSRREKMFIISSDCTEPGESCFCNISGGKGFADTGFDLNVSQIKNGFIIEAGSKKGEEFLEKHPQLFTDLPKAATDERDKNREQTQQQLEKNNADLKFELPIRKIVEDSEDSDVFETESKRCIECQACTRVCPTCHCFYLYDNKRKGYFDKMKMWDSCMRMAYAAVAGGANPRKAISDRMQHRFLHKFVYFLDRYGLEMCIGCGRCVDADAGGMDIRQMLKGLNEEQKAKA